ncbi:Ig-like domain-containing protein, partial [Ferrimonas senticii]|uniref:Ig-like domain-containing protein n=1 Tax=Ferrimonas senticii TaxID=394566 RepID=UPI0012EC2706
MQSQVLGSTVKITHISGAVELLVTNLEGEERLVQVGDIVYAGETILMPTSVAIEFDEVASPTASTANNDDAEVDAVIELLRESQEALPETAAGNGETDGSDSFVNVDRTAAETLAQSRFDTEGPAASPQPRLFVDNDLPLNTDPVANNDRLRTDEDTPVNLNLLSNDRDADGNGLSISSINGISLTGQAQTIAVTNGQLQIGTDGSIQFIPADNFHGTVTFDYQISDGNGGSDSATVNIEVAPTNDDPIANNDAIRTDEDTPVAIDALANDTDSDGDLLSIVEASVAPDQGTVTIENGQLVFTPAANFVGEAQINYTISDGNGGTSSATVTVTVNDVNDAPTSEDLIDRSGEDGEVVSLDVSGNFEDIDGTLTFSAEGLPAGLVIDPDTGIISGTINSDASESGPYSVTITATDDDGATTTETFEWAVTNPSPVAEDDSATTDEDTPVTIDVLGNDSDDDALTVTVASSPNGTVVINDDGTLTFTPNANFNGDTTISYTVTDANGATNSATVTVTVNDVNDAPTSEDLIDRSSADGDSINIDVSANFEDIDGTLTFSAEGLPAGLVIDPDTGIISGTINSDASESGPYSVTIT